MKDELVTKPGGQSATTTPLALLDAKQCGALLGCSARHWTRLVDMGKAPGRIKVGHLTKWRRVEVEQWIDDGCKPVRAGRVAR